MAIPLQMEWLKDRIPKQLDAATKSARDGRLSLSVHTKE